MTVEGPSKVKLECLECPEGFRVHYTPMAPGNYLISIKYGGPNHIPGSPFKAKVTGMVQDLLRVLDYGIRHVYLYHQYHSLQ